MKKLLVAVSCLFAVQGMAQATIQEEVDLIRKMYGKTKKELMTNYLKVPEAKSASFWGLYDEYEAARANLAKERMQLIADYARDYETLNDETANTLATATLNNNMQLEKLYKKYFGKMKKQVGALEAAKFIQVESYFQTAIRSEVQDAIPLIGEIDRTKKQ